MDPSQAPDPNEDSTATSLALCDDLTFRALIDSGAASAEECRQAAETCRISRGSGIRIDPLLAVATVQSKDREPSPEEITLLAESTAATLSQAPPLIPFAGQLIIPYAFYETFPRVHRLAADLLAPVIYSEDADSLGIASVNPLAAKVMADAASAAVKQQMGTTPFLTVVRMDPESWNAACRKHFGNT
jgi:hypothetical protein